MAGNDWSRAEVELIVADYFEMLKVELSGSKYNKAQHNRNIRPHLNNRSKGSVEFKHQNISAAMKKLGYPFIKGYLPRYRYQKSILDNIILEYLKNNPEMERYFSGFVEKEINPLKATYDFEKIEVEPPKANVIEEPASAYKKIPVKVDYIEKEQKNRKLGSFGEETILKYEKWSLIRKGKKDLADKVEWISKKQGDGLGYDILSFEEDGREKYIEVKTTKLSKETPIFFTKNELDFSIEHAEQYYLYRLFNIEGKAGLFIKKGDLNTICQSVPMTYKGFF